VAFSQLPALGAAAGGVRFVGLTTRPDGIHCAVLLLDAKPPRRMNWNDAMAWAAEQGAELPARTVSALLFANARDQFEEGWHWTCEQYSASDAWTQLFYNGDQINDSKVYEARARAVRLIQITA